MVIDTKSFQDHKKKEKKKRKITNPHHILKKPLEMMCKYLAVRESMYQMG